MQYHHAYSFSLVMCPVVSNALHLWTTCTGIQWNLQKRTAGDLGFLIYQPLKIHVTNIHTRIRVMKTPFSLRLEPKISLWLHANLLNEVCLILCILNLTNKKKYIRINACYTLEMLFTHSILQFFPGHHLVSSQIQSYTLPHSILHLKRKFSRRLSGKTSPDTPQRKLWKNLFLRLISANGLSVMQKESL